MAARTGKGNTKMRGIRVAEELWSAAKLEAERRGESLAAAIKRFLEGYARGE